MLRTLCALFLALTASTLTAEEWTEIDLARTETEGNWIEQPDGSLHLQPREGERGWQRYGSYLWFDGEYEDFICELEYKHEEGGNSGFHFRVSDVSQPVTTGLELQLLDCHGKEEVGFHDLGGIIKFVERKHGAPRVNAAKPAGEWNTVRVVLKDDLLSVIINGKTVQDKLDLTAHEIEGGLAPKGRIGIQDHGQPFWVRNIRIKRLQDE